jgi:hypothetical protein
MEIAPDIVHPLLRKKPKELCAMLEGQALLRVEEGGAAPKSSDAHTWPRRRDTRK